jgi:fission process protein 1
LQTDPGDQERTKRVLIAAGDTLVWQALASVAIPGFTINRVCATSLYVLKRTTKLPKPTRKWITTGLGLACIPFIVHPIDNLVTKLMDNSVRKWITIEKSDKE